MGLVLIVPWSATTAQAQDSAGDLGEPRPGAAAREHEPAAEPPPPPPGRRGRGAGGRTPRPPPDYPTEDGGFVRGGRYPLDPGSVALLETQGFRISSRVATKLRVLDRNFAALAARGGSSIVDGILSIITGGLAITFAVIIDEEALSTY